MAKSRIKFCTRCMNIIRKNDEKCSKCGLSVKKMLQEVEKQEDSTAQIFVGRSKEENIPSLPVEPSEENVRLVTQEVEEISSTGEVQEEKAQEEKAHEDVSADDGKTGTAQEYEDIDSLNQDNMDMKRVGTVTFESEPTKPKRHKHKSKARKEDKPKYTIDEDGNFNIDTSDVTYLEGVEKPTSSIKQARGELNKEKTEWWDIYKWADRMLAKRKIMKEVNKASRKTPEGINQMKAIAWCVFFGWLGAHNFYAKNNKKGWTVVALDVIMLLVFTIPGAVDVVGVSIGGGCGFVMFAMWLLDLFGLCTKRFKYRISKEEFISNLNVNTRAKLGKKYIDLDKATFKTKEKVRLEKLYKRKNKKKNKKKKDNLTNK